MSLLRETKENFTLQEKIKIEELQIQLEKYRCRKINSLANRAKNNKELTKAKIYFRAWGCRMVLANNLQKEHKKLVTLIEKEKKNVLNISGNTKSLRKTKSNSELREVC